MRAAIIFPPQWDPRQPPLAPAILAASFHNAGIEIRHFDLNLALYRQLLKPSIEGDIEDYLQKKLLDPENLRNAQAYLQTSEQLQKIFDEKFDPQGSSRLFWDACQGFPAIASSKDWQRIIVNEKPMPAIRHLQKHISALLDWAPDLACFSVISDTQLAVTLSLAAIIRRHRPDTRIIAGGSAFAYRRSLFANQKWLAHTFDFICLGEAEPIIEALTSGNIATTAQPQNLETHPANLQQNNAELCNFAKPTIPDFSGMPLSDYLTPSLVMPLETARSCPWGRCAFCIHPVRAANGRPSYRPKPAAMVEQEIKQLFASGCRHFFIIDEAIPPSRLQMLANMFLSLPEAVNWIGYARLDEGHNHEIFTKARQSGCLKLFIGVESGSDKILSQFNKGTNAKRAERVLTDLAAAGIAAHFFLMTGFPDETRSDRQATLNLLAKVLPKFDPFGFSFDLFPLNAELETDMLADPQAYGLKMPYRGSGNDLCWQFPLLSGTEGNAHLSDFRRQINDLADRILGSDFGLRHACLAQDSLHLLLLANY